ncbi:MAG: ABC transporter permease [Gammaproteobacteria bacterium]|nr:ABC transporter permease [Gammaproteobacteria bacterium]MCW8841028.1 ABC transporter permease [Gammaproteobacteria bacterium]MCW8927712.1 ABC transporter permease [Gammaproteobacteria bacterium]MCW8959784.1 ABC transporter permease [Gammaproteobacteria bacterium]MCW8972007.1 ABC transporter permease [Gammaproteobacteria bacterium]
MWWNALLLALRSIRRNVMRSFLTTLGIVIGVASVIIMVNLGSGATQQVKQQIESLGSNLLFMRVGQRFGHGQRGQAAPFEMADAEAIAMEVPGVAEVAPIAARSMTTIYGNANWNTSVTGSDNRYFAVGNWELASGRYFSDSELRGGKSVCVIGETVRQKLFGAQPPVGSAIRIKSLSCEVIGLLRSKGQSAGGTDQDDTIVMPMRAFWRRIAGNRDVSRIHISARDGVSTTAVVRDVEQLMRERRRIAPGQEDDFNVMDLREITDTLTGTTRILTALLGAVAAVSLLVGGIGIMNIMLVSVTERTREIGIRLAIGALERDVLTQFLVEAVVLSSFGGIVGIALALTASWFIAGALTIPYVVEPGMVLFALLFSMAIGVAFGYFPARKAARLDPIDALRHE